MPAALFERYQNPDKPDQERKQKKFAHQLGIQASLDSPVKNVPPNYFVNRSRDWLEEELRACQEDIAAGKTLTSYGSGDVSGGKQVNMSAEERFSRLYYALYLLAPDEFPLSGMRRTTITVGRHNAGRHS